MANCNKVHFQIANSNKGQQIETSRQNKWKGPAADLSVSKMAKSSHSGSQRAAWTDLGGGGTDCQKEQFLQKETHQDSKHHLKNEPPEE